MPHPSSHRSVFLGLAGLTALLAGCSGGESTTSGSGTTGTPDPKPTFNYPHDGEIRLNHLQAKGSHNSYHIAGVDPIVPLAYTHAPLDVQFREQGVRQIELDTHYSYVKEVYEVYHLGGTIDDRTTCRLLVDCMKTMKGWSDANPAHQPIFVQIEPKDEVTMDEAEDLFKRLEDEVLSVFPRSRIITPDDVRGSAAGVREALATKGWPTLGEVRGKIIFFLDNATTFRDYYTHGSKDLEGRLMFINADPESPWAGVLLANNPDGDSARIAAALKANLIVRTRADGDNVEPFAGDTTHRDQALASGAQLVSTDYPVPVKGVNYVVEIPGGTPARCNPVTAPEGCMSEWIEDPRFMEK